MELTTLPNAGSLLYSEKATTEDLCGLRLAQTQLLPERAHLGTCQQAVHPLLEGDHQALVDAGLGGICLNHSFFLYLLSSEG